MAKKFTTPAPSYTRPGWRPALNRLHQPSAAPHAQGTRRQRDRGAQRRAALQDAAS